MSVSNKEIADCFRAARGRIASRSDRYICYALGYSTNFMPVFMAVRNKCIETVMKGIHGHATLATWLCDECPWLNSVEPTARENIFYLARLAWLDKLIEEYSK